MKETTLENQPSEAQPARLTFDAELFKRASEFCDAALIAVPELEGVAVVPLWSVQPEKTPNGLLKLRSMQPPYVGSLLKLVARLTAFSVDAHRDLVMQLQMFDRHAAELAAQIEARQQQLAAPPAEGGATANG
jgi:hypothetical protein